MSTFEFILQAAPETLADTLRKHARQLTDEDLEVLVAGLREQRSRWNLAPSSKKAPVRRQSAGVPLPPLQTKLR